MADNNQDNDLDIKIGIDDSGVEEGLKSVEAKLDAVAKGIESALSFTFDTAAIKKAEESLLALTNITFDSITDELTELSTAMMKLNVFDPSKLEQLGNIDDDPVVAFNRELLKLQESLLRTASMSQLNDSEFLKGMSSESIAQASMELSSYQASLSGVSEALRAQLSDTQQMGSATEGYTEILNQLVDALDTVEIEMDQIDDVSQRLASAMERIGQVQIDPAQTSNMDGLNRTINKAAESAEQGAQRIEQSMNEMYEATKRTFSYSSDDAMIARGQALAKMSAEVQVAIEKLREMLQATRQSSDGLRDNSEDIAHLERCIASASKQLRGYQEELAFIKQRLEDAGRAQEVFNNKAAGGGGSGLPVSSTLSTPDSPDTTKVVSGVREATAAMKEALDAATTWQQRLGAVATAAGQVAKQTAENVKKTTLLEQITKRLKKEWAEMGRIVKGIVFSQMFYGFTNAVKTAIQDMKEFAMQVEETAAAFGIMMGDAEQGMRLSEELMKLAADTPLSFEQVNAGVRKLKAYGFETQNLITVLEGVADASAAAGDPQAFDRIILALGQVNSKGKLAGQEINQLAEAGINVKKYLMEGLNLTAEQLAKVQQLSIPSDVAIKVILDGIKKQYGGAAEEISNTMTGLSATVKDNFQIIGQAMWDPFFQATKGLLTKVRDVTDEWRNIVLQMGFGGLLEKLFPKSFVDQLRLVIANFEVFRTSVFKIIQAILPFIQALAHVGMVIANSILPFVNAFIHVLAAGVSIISKNEFAMRLLTAAFMGMMVAKAVTFFMSHFLTIVQGVTAGVTWAFKGVRFFTGALLAGIGPIRAFATALLTGRIAAGDFTAMISAAVGILTALVFSSEKASQTMTKMMGSLTKTMGKDFSKIYVPKMEQSSDITGEFSEQLTVSQESLDKLGDAAKDASKKAKNAVAAFDEVFTLTEKDEDSSSLLDDWIMPDLNIPDVEIPEVDYSDLFEDAEDVIDDYESLWDKFWDSWLGKALKWAGEALEALSYWLWESLAGFTSWATDSLILFTWWAAESLAKFLWWAGESLLGFTKWIIESAASFAGWSVETLSGFALWVGDSLLQFSQWSIKSLLEFSLWVMESIGQFVGWAGDSLVEFTKWSVKSLGAFTEWAYVSLAGFGAWAAESLLGFTQWAFTSASTFAGWALETATGFGQWAADSLIGFGQWAAESMAGFGQWILDSLTKFKDWVVESSGGFGQWVLDSIALFSDWKNLTWDKIQTWASDSLNALTNWVKSSVGGFSNWVKDTIGKFTDWASDSLTTFGQWALDSLAEFLNWAAESAAGFITWMADSLSTFGSWVTESLGKFATWASESITAFGTWATDALGKFQEWFDESLRKLGEWSIETLKKFANWAAESIKGIVSWAQQTGKKFSDWASSTGKKLGDWVNDTDKKFRDWATDSLNRFSDWASDSVRAFTDWVSDTLKAVSNWGTNLWNAIISPLQKVWDKVSGMTSSLTTMVSDIFASGQGRSINVDFDVDDPDFPTPSPFSISSPDMPTMRAAIVPKLTAPKVPSLATSSITARKTQTQKVDFAGIGKEIAEYLLPALVNNNTGTQEQLPPVYVGTLIADERGLRELERKMQVVRLQEKDRRK